MLNGTAHQVDTVYPSNNYMLDNILDNLIASMLLSKKIPHERDCER